MGEWQCFRYKEDEEFENSVNFKKCHQIINKRKNSSNTKIKIGRNEPCICGSGKKYKKCCIYKSNSNFLEDLNFIDQNVSKAIWYLQRNELKKADNLFRIAWLSVKDICIKNNIKSINEYDEKYEGYDFLSNWIQEYDEILEFSDKKSKIYERLDLCNDLEKIFDLKNVNQIYWKEKVIRATANSQFKLGNEKEATRIIEDYLKQNKLWTWGYIEMADWYDDKSNLPYYNLNKAKDILLRAESIENLEDMDRIYERLENIYTKLGDKEKAKEYNIKWQNYDS
jgi:hypothetical protein